MRGRACNPGATSSQGSYRPGRRCDTSALSLAQLPCVKLGLSVLAPDMLARTTIAHLEAFEASFHIGVPLGRIAGWGEMHNRNAPRVFAR